MLEWKEVHGMNEKLNHVGNIKCGVNLPELNEEVLFCRSSYRDNTKDIYFSGYIYEGRYGLTLVNLISGGVDSVVDGIKWARFNKPETQNNKRYAVAYLDEYGKGFLKDIPNIVEVEKDTIEQLINELREKGYTRITPFSYILPCTFDYDWDYIEAHKVS